MSLRDPSGSLSEPNHGSTQNPNVLTHATATQPTPAAAHQQPNPSGNAPPGASPSAQTSVPQDATTTRGQPSHLAHELTQQPQEAAAHVRPRGKSAAAYEDPRAVLREAHMTQAGHDGHDDQDENSNYDVSSDDDERLAQAAQDYEDIITQKAQAAARTSTRRSRRTPAMANQWEGFVAPNLTPRVVDVGARSFKPLSKSTAMAIVTDAGYAAFCRRVVSRDFIALARTRDDFLMIPCDPEFHVTHVRGTVHRDIDDDELVCALQSLAVIVPAKIKSYQDSFGRDLATVTRHLHSDLQPATVDHGAASAAAAAAPSALPPTAIKDRIQKNWEGARHTLAATATQTKARMEDAANLAIAAGIRGFGHASDLVDGAVSRARILKDTASAKFDDFASLTSDGVPRVFQSAIDVTRRLRDEGRALRANARSLYGNNFGDSTCVDDKGFCAIHNVRWTTFGCPLEGHIPPEPSAALSHAVPGSVHIVDGLEIYDEEIAFGVEGEDIDRAVDDRSTLTLFSGWKRMAPFDLEPAWVQMLKAVQREFGSPRVPFIPTAAEYVRGSMFTVSGPAVRMTVISNGLTSTLCPETRMGTFPARPFDSDVVESHPGLIDDILNNRTVVMGLTTHLPGDHQAPYKLTRLNQDMAGLRRGVLIACTHGMTIVYIGAWCSNPDNQGWTPAPTKVATLITAKLSRPLFTFRRINRNPDIDGDDDDMASILRRNFASQEHRMRCQRLLGHLIQARNVDSLAGLAAWITGVYLSECDIVGTIDSGEPIAIALAAMPPLAALLLGFASMCGDSTQKFVVGAKDFLLDAGRRSDAQNCWNDLNVLLQSDRVLHGDIIVTWTHDSDAPPMTQISDKCYEINAARLYSLECELLPDQWGYRLTNLITGTENAWVSPLKRVGRRTIAALEKFFSLEPQSVRQAGIGDAGGVFSRIIEVFTGLLSVDVRVQDVVSLLTTLSKVNSGVKAVSDLGGLISSLISSICLAAFDFDPLSTERSRIHVLLRAVQHEINGFPQKFDTTEAAREVLLICQHATWVSATAHQLGLPQLTLGPGSKFAQAHDEARRAVGAQRRVQPVGIMLAGPPATGKTTLMQNISELVAVALTGYPDKVVSMTESDRNFWDTRPFPQDSAVLCINETLSYTDASTSLKEEQNLIDTSPFFGQVINPTVDIAALFQSVALVIQTTNCRKLDEENYAKMRNPEANSRRTSVYALLSRRVNNQEVAPLDLELIHVAGGDPALYAEFCRERQLPCRVVDNAFDFDYGPVYRKHDRCHVVTGKVLVSFIIWSWMRNKDVAHSGLVPHYDRDTAKSILAECGVNIDDIEAQKRKYAQPGHAPLPTQGDDNTRQAFTPGLPAMIDWGMYERIVTLLNSRRKHRGDPELAPLDMTLSGTVKTILARVGIGLGVTAAIAGVALAGLIAYRKFITPNNEPQAATPYPDIANLSRGQRQVGRIDTGLRSVGGPTGARQSGRVTHNVTNAHAIGRRHLCYVTIDSIEQGKHKREQSYGWLSGSGVVVPSHLLADGDSASNVVVMKDGIQIYDGPVVFGTAWVDKDIAYLGLKLTRLYPCILKSMIKNQPFEHDPKAAAGKDFLYVTLAGDHTHVETVKGFGIVEQGYKTADHDHAYRYKMLTCLRASAVGDCGAMVFITEPHLQLIGMHTAGRAGQSHSQLFGAKDLIDNLNILNYPLGSPVVENLSRLSETSSLFQDVNVAQGLQVGKDADRSRLSPQGAQDLLDMAEGHVAGVYFEAEITVPKGSPAPVVMTPSVTFEADDNKIVDAFCEALQTSHPRLSFGPALTGRPAGVGEPDYIAARLGMKGSLWPERFASEAEIIEAAQAQKPGPDHPIGFELARAVSTTKRSTSGGPLCARIGGRVVPCANKENLYMFLTFDEAMAFEYPDNLEYQAQFREWLVANPNQQDYVVAHREVIAECYSWFDQLARGCIPDAAVVTAFPKNEMRPIQKVKKTRAIYSYTFATNLLMEALHGQIIAARPEGSIGMNVYGPEWDDMCQSFFSAPGGSDNGVFDEHFAPLGLKYPESLQCDITDAEAFDASINFPAFQYISSRFDAWYAKVHLANVALFGREHAEDLRNARRTVLNLGFSSQLLFTTRAAGRVRIFALPSFRLGLGSGFDGTSFLGLLALEYFKGMSVKGMHEKIGNREITLRAGMLAHVVHVDYGDDWASKSALSDETPPPGADPARIYGNVYVSEERERAYFDASRESGLRVTDAATKGEPRLYHTPHHQRFLGRLITRPGEPLNRSLDPATVAAISSWSERPETEEGRKSRYLAAFVELAFYGRATFMRVYEAAMADPAFSQLCIPAYDQLVRDFGLRVGGDQRPGTPSARTAGGYKLARTADLRLVSDIVSCIRQSAPTDSKAPESVNQGNLITPLMEVTTAADSIALSTNAPAVSHSVWMPYTPARPTEPNAPMTLRLNTVPAQIYIPNADSLGRTPMTVMSLLDMAVAGIPITERQASTRIYPAMTYETLRVTIIYAKPDGWVGEPEFVVLPYTATRANPFGVTSGKMSRQLVQHCQKYKLIVGSNTFDFPMINPYGNFGFTDLGDVDGPSHQAGIYFPMGAGPKTNYTPGTGVTLVGSFSVAITFVKPMWVNRQERPLVPALYPFNPAVPALPEYQQATLARATTGRRARGAVTAEKQSCSSQAAEAEVKAKAADIGASTSSVLGTIEQIGKTAATVGGALAMFAATPHIQQATQPSAFPVMPTSITAPTGGVYPGWTRSDPDVFPGVADVASMGGDWLSFGNLRRALNIEDFPDDPAFAQIRLEPFQAVTASREGGVVQHADIMDLACWLYNKYTYDDGELFFEMSIPPQPCTFHYLLSAPGQPVPASRADIMDQPHEKWHIQAGEKLSKSVPFSWQNLASVAPFQMANTLTAGFNPTWTLSYFLEHPIGPTKMAMLADIQFNNFKAFIPIQRRKPSDTLWRSWTPDSRPLAPFTRYLITSPSHHISISGVQTTTDCARAILHADDWHAIHERNATFYADQRAHNLSPGVTLTRSGGRRDQWAETSERQSSRFPSMPVPHVVGGHRRDTPAPNIGDAQESIRPLLSMRVERTMQVPSAASTVTRNGDHYQTTLWTFFCFNKIPDAYYPDDGVPTPESSLLHSLYNIANDGPSLAAKNGGAMMAPWLDSFQTMMLQLCGGQASWTLDVLPVFTDTILAGTPLATQAPKVEWRQFTVELSQLDMIMDPNVVFDTRGCTSNRWLPTSEAIQIHFPFETELSQQFPNMGFTPDGRVNVLQFEVTEPTGAYAHSELYLKIGRKIDDCCLGRPLPVNMTRLTWW